MKKKNILLSIVLTALAIASFGQNEIPKSEAGHKVIMQVTQSDSLTQLAVVGQIRNIKNHLPDAHIEVVCHANALDLLVKTGSKVKAQINELSKMNVSFIACENTMARKKITIQDLLPEVKTVPSGLAEIILKQEDGWPYVKGGY